MQRLPHLLALVLMASASAAVEVNLYPSASSVTEGGSVTLIAVRSDNTGSLQVPVVLVGAPVFANLDPEFSFAAGSSMAMLTLATVGNDAVDGARQVTAQITVGGGVTSSIPAVTVGVRDDEVTATVQAVDVLASEDGVPADTAQVRIVVGGEPRTVDLVVQFEVHGTAAFTAHGPNDYALEYTVDGVTTAVTPLDGIELVNVTFPVGVNEAVITLTPLPDALVEGAETCEIRLSTASLAYLVTGADRLPMTIADDDNRITGLMATPAFESGPNGSVTIAFLSAYASRTVQIPYLISGVTNGVDIIALSGVATLVQGQTSVSIAIDALADEEPEGETLQFTLLSSADYVLPGTPTIAVPIIDLAGIASIAEAEPAIESAADQPLRFAVTVDRHGGFEAEVLLVPFRIGGGDPAAGPAEYTVGGDGVSWDAVARTGVVELGSMVTVAYIEVAPVDDAVADGDKIVRVVLEDGQSVTAAVGSSSAEGTIMDDEPVVGILRTGEDTITEGGDAAEFYVSYPGVPGGAARGLPVQVRFTVGGSAGVSDRSILGEGVVMDGNGLAGTVTIPANELGTSILVTALADAVAEVPEQVIVTLQVPSPGSSFRIGEAASASVELVDVDVRPTVSIEALAAAIEGRSINCFKITRTGAVTDALDVHLQPPAGSATSGDYQALPDVVSIPAGATHALLPVRAISDGEDYEDLVVSIDARDDYLIGTGMASVDIVSGFADNQLQISSELGDPILGIDEDWSSEVMLVVPVGVTAGRSRAVLSTASGGPAVPAWMSVHRVTDAGDPGPIRFRLQGSPPIGTEEGAVPFRLELQVDIDVDGTFELALPQDLLLWVRSAGGGWMRNHVLVCTALSLLAGCGGGSYGPAAPGGPPVDPPVDPPGPLVVLDLATGAFTEATGLPVLADDRIYFRRVGGTAELSAADAVNEDGTDDTTTVTDVAVCWLSVYEISQGQWARLAASVPAHAAPWTVHAAHDAFGGAASIAATKPAFGVSWDALQAVLSSWNDGTGHAQLRAPSASEWEYACRSGAEVPTRYAWGSSESAVTAGTLARVRETRAAGLGPAACGSLQANPAGFHDMPGNVWEWVSGDQPALRGGSWFDNLRSAASGNVLAMDPDIPYPTAGVRLVLETP